MFVSLPHWLVTTFVMTLGALNYSELPTVGTFSFLQSYQRTVCDFCLRDAHHPDEHAGEVLIF